MTTMYEAVREVWPNADPWWAGHPSMDGAVIRHLDCHIVTSPGGAGEYDVGLYDVHGWESGHDDLHTMYVFDSVEHVLAFVDKVTEFPPNDWYNAATHWANAQFDAGTLEGAR
jgi:hypothetical protein